MSRKAIYISNDKTIPCRILESKGKRSIIEVKGKKYEVSKKKLHEDIDVDYGSENSINKVQNDWKNIAKEPVDVEYIKGAYFGFCSELAAYRLLAKYGYESASKGKTGIGKGGKGWFFKLEVK
jgi:hypothetical protein